MAYVHKILSDDEKLISISKLHWIYPLEGMLIFILFFVAGALADHFLEVYTGKSSVPMHISVGWLLIDNASGPFKWLLGIAGFAVFCPLFLAYISTEVGLTDKRLIYKKGVLFIEVQELDLEDIRAENIIHGWFGWLFRYGKIQFDCRFVNSLFIPAVKNPYRLIKASHIARMKRPDFDFEVAKHSLELEAGARKLRNNKRMISTALLRDFRNGSLEETERKQR